MSYRITDSDMYKLVLENTYLSLAQGIEEDVINAILEVYEEEENYEACAAIITALENWKNAETNCRVKKVW